jgi:hypothetical protein
MRRHVILAIAVSAGLTTGVLAQDQKPSGFHSVTCVKIRDGKGTEYRQFAEETRSMAQAAADAGQMKVSYRMRSVMPAGAAATCDYVYVTVYDGIPPAPTGPAGLESLIKKSGVSMTADQFRAKRTSLTNLVSSEMWRTAVDVGAMEKGDYLYVNHMKVHEMDAWLELENAIWKPMAQAWVKDGTLRGWMVARPVVPNGSDLKYQAITVDVMPKWESAFKGVPLEKTFKQIHSDKNLNDVMAKIEKARDLAYRELLVVEDKIVPAGKSSASGGGQ